jgi:alpha-glucosidase (family GH31 glycosyl hydrolase)
LDAAFFFLRSDNGVTANVARQSLLLRYSLFPYLYTLLFDSHLQGSLLWNPLWFWFPQDRGTHRMENQVMLGDCLMLRPVLSREESRKEKVLVYFPRATSALNTLFPFKTQW